jgi:anti-anti-sigma factor
MNAKPVQIQVAVEGNTLVVAPVGLLGELEYEECEADLEAVLKRCESPDVRNVVLDLGGVELFGSSAVGWFIEMSHRIAPRGGQMVLCHVSNVGKEVLRASKLEGHWPLYASRGEGLAALRKQGG